MSEKSTVASASARPQSCPFAEAAAFGNTKGHASGHHHRAEHDALQLAASGVMGTGLIHGPNGTD